MKERTRRAERLADLVRQELGQLLERGVKDPRIGFVTITRVDLSGDLRTAHVSVSVLGSEQQQRESMAGLEAAAKFLRYELAQRLRLRHVPAIQFHLDSTGQQQERIEALFRQIKAES